MYFGLRKKENLKSFDKLRQLDHISLEGENAFCEFSYQNEILPLPVVFDCLEGTGHKMLNILVLLFMLLDDENERNS
jgi:hypothetical protein